MTRRTELSTSGLLSALLIATMASSKTHAGNGPQTGSAAEAASWTGEYGGYVICDRVQDGGGSNFGVQVSVGIVHEGDTLHMAVSSTLDGGGRPPSSLYHGLLRLSRSGDVGSCFLEACRPSFPYKEQMRIFPATPSRVGFGFAADSIFISDGMLGGDWRAHRGKLQVVPRQNLPAGARHRVLFYPTIGAPDGLTGQVIGPAARQVCIADSLTEDKRWTNRSL